jgi:hypothetical protein
MEPPTVVWVLLHQLVVKKIYYIHMFLEQFVRQFNTSISFFPRWLQVCVKLSSEGTLSNCWIPATVSWLGIAKSQRSLRSEKTECVGVDQCLSPSWVCPPPPSAFISSLQHPCISENVAWGFCSYTPSVGKNLATPHWHAGSRWWYWVVVPSLFCSLGHLAGLLQETQVFSFLVPLYFTYQDWDKSPRYSGFSLSLLSMAHFWGPVLTVGGCAYFSLSEQWVWEPPPVTMLYALLFIPVAWPHSVGDSMKQEKVPLTAVSWVFHTPPSTVVFPGCSDRPLIDFQHFKASHSISYGDC